MIPRVPQFGSLASVEVESFLDVNQCLRRGGSSIPLGHLPELVQKFGWQVHGEWCSALIWSFLAWHSPTFADPDLRANQAPGAGLTEHCERPTSC
jgi:hypothetical protein